MRFNRNRTMFFSRRSTVMAPNGIVATSQPLAAQAGISILQQGGNAVDAAVTTAAVLNVVEPGSIGIGGDVFALIYDSHQGTLEGLNASGWSPANATIETYQHLGFRDMPVHGLHSITVPGALAGWDALLVRYGTLSFTEVLQPAIKYAQHGFPISERVAWKSVETKLRHNPGGHEYLVQGRAPRPGQRFSQNHLATTFQQIAREGAEVFYQGTLCKQIVTFLQQHGSLITDEDLTEYQPEWVKPLSVDYKGYTLYELPPNCQGICALEALQIASRFSLDQLEYLSSDYLHTLIESMKLAFADGHHYIADPRFRDIPSEQLISQSYCGQRGALITDKAISYQSSGIQGADTAYLTIIDKDRNMVSFINSLYNNFGSGVVVEGTGITLQNRGSSFALDATHNNCLEPRKRPYHTIIPAMLFRDREPYISFGVMGGHMQPQGHLQVTSNIVNFEMNPQDALDAPRFRYENGTTVLVEDTIPVETRNKLMTMGHDVGVRVRLSSQFGGGQIIVVNKESGCLYAGSEPRKDGCAIGY